ncbi:WSC-domain-containing protein [Periconia macrospinosa]|uniref:WSC-domain-containing protein n=1 Tax=Periconia macrospinosa TaxID=97972 RepID=A0A2V1DKY6_9PLEO|nr:WSC-domain-containing protein [Periconia macrospinosa]
MSSIKRIVLGLYSLTRLVTATSEDKPPCAQGSYTPYKYLGCFEDSRDSRSLSYRSDLGFDSVTVESCTAVCKANGYHYAGLEYYGECYCGTDIASSQVSDSQCTYPCNGDKSQTCGGSNLLSVYADPTIMQNVAEPKDYVSLGCWTDGNGGRALGFNQADNVNGSELTTKMCLQACGSRGFGYAGTEYSQECYCGTQLDDNSER